MPTANDIAVRAYNRGQSVNRLQYLMRDDRTGFLQTLAAVELRLDVENRNLSDIRAAAQLIADRHGTPRMRPRSRVRIVTYVLAEMTEDPSEWNPQPNHHNRQALRAWYNGAEK